MTITPWRERLNWKGQASPTSAERMKAAEAEIKELRQYIARLEKRNPVVVNSEKHKQAIQEQRKIAQKWADKYRNAQKKIARLTKPVPIVAPQSKYQTKWVQVGHKTS